MKSQINMVIKITPYDFPTISILLFYPILSPTLALTKVEQDILPELPSEDVHEQ